MATLEELMEQQGCLYVDHFQAGYTIASRRYESLSTMGGYGSVSGFPTSLTPIVTDWALLSSGKIKIPPNLRLTVCNEIAMHSSVSSELPLSPTAAKHAS